MNAIKQAEIENGLAQFIGTEGYHIFSILFRNTVLTDGARWLAEKAGAFWLMDIIGSIERLVKDEEFVSVKLVCHEIGATFTADDGNGNILYTQEIEHTDFPLPEIQLFAIKQPRADGYYRVILLTGEY